VNNIMNREMVGRVLKSKPVRQVASLFGSQILFLIGGMVTNGLNTRFLDPTSFGRYSFAFSVSEFVNLFIDFGFYSSGARILALEEGSRAERRKLIGGLTLVGVLLSLVAGLIVFGISFFTATLFKSDIGPMLRLLSALFGLAAMQTLVESICRGDNRIGTLSLFRIGAKALHVLLIVSFVLGGVYGLGISILVSLLSHLAAAIVVIITVKPILSGMRASLAKLIADVRVYGWNAYVGNIASTASYRTDSMLISAYADAASVGFYNLGNLLTFPMAAFSRSVSITLFKDFTQQDRISRRVIGVNALWLGLCAMGLIILRGFLVHLLFGKGYEPVIQLILPLALTGMFSGLAVPYNMFMGAKGMGAYLRNTSLIMTAVNIGLNVLMIPRYKALGASYASLIALSINYVLHLIFYRKTLRRIKEKES
jgi:O-antigen/teichoic acid export membrane protein